MNNIKKFFLPEARMGRSGAKRLFAALLLGALLCACGGGGDATTSVQGSPSAPVTQGPGGATAPGDTGATTGDAGGSTGSTAGGGDGDGGGTPDSSGVAAGTGSGGTGGSGDAGSGTGSGGTGVNAGTAVGSVDGFGSVIVNGSRFDTTTASFDLEDINALAFGHVVRIDGSVNAARAIGVATVVHAAQELQGTVQAVQPGAATFTVLGQLVSVSTSTVFDGLNAVSDLAAGDSVQVSGLPFQAGQLLATRIAKRAGVFTNLVVTGQVTSADVAAKTVQVGALSVSYMGGTTIDGAVSTTLKTGAYVRVNGTMGANGALSAARIRPWQVAPADQVPVTWSGVISDYISTSAFNIASLQVDASAAQITGGPASAIGNGVRVELDGVMNGAVFKATKLRIKHVPGTGGPASYSVIGAIGAFVSPSSFKVQGQPIHAGGSGVVFVNGTASNLKNGQRVTVVGSQIADGVLIATKVTFE